MRDSNSNKEQLLKVSYKDIYLTEKLKPEDKPEFDAFVKQVEEETYNKILKNPKRLLKQATKPDNNPQVKYRGAVVRQEDAKHIHQGIRKTAIMSFKPTWRGRCVIVCKKGLLSGLGGKAIAIANLRSAKQLTPTIAEQEGIKYKEKSYIWYFQKINHIDLFSVDFRNKHPAQMFLRVTLPQEVVENEKPRLKRLRKRR